MKTIRIIAYGTLMRGECNHHYFRNAVSIRGCIITGILYDTGLGYPAFVPEKSGKVAAELAEIPLEDLPEVDKLEDYPNEYTRQIITAELPDGTKETGWVYIMNRLPSRATVIPCGDWRNR